VLATARTNSRGVSFVDDFDAATGPMALVLQLRLEHAPAGVQHGLRHACLGQLQAAHVAHDDVLVVLHDATGERVDRVQSAVRCFGVVALRLPIVAPALGLGDLVLDVAIKRPGVQRRAIAGGGHALEAQVDAHGLVRRDIELDRHLHRHVEEPLAQRVLRERPVAELHPFQTRGLEQTQRLLAECHAYTGTLEACRLEGDPAEASLRSGADPPAQLRALELPALAGVLAVDPLDRVRANPVEALRGPGG